MADGVRWWESNRNLGFAGTLAATVIGGVLLNQLGVLPLGRWLSTTIAFLIWPIPVPFVIAAAFVGAMTHSVIRGLRRRASSRPVWLSYKQDTLLGVVWRWTYSGDLLLESTASAFCPHCELRLRVDSPGYMQRQTELLCDGCGHRAVINGSPREVVERVVRLVEREANRRAAPAPGS
jgi:hypothetical protein